MHPAVLWILALVAAALPALPAAAQQPPAAAGAVRALLAVGKLPSLTEAPQHFLLRRIELPDGGRMTATAPSAVVYIAEGQVAIAAPRERPTVHRAGEELFVPAGTRIGFKNQGDGPAIILHFALGAADDLAKPFTADPITVTVLGRSPEVPGLRPGPYEFGVTLVTVPPRGRPPPLHHRSGAAFYYVAAGAGQITMEDGRSEPRPAGAVQFEPVDFMHSWANAGDGPLLLLQANISPEGVPEIIFPK